MSNCYSIKQISQYPSSTYSSYRFILKHFVFTLNWRTSYCHRMYCYYLICRPVDTYCLTFSKLGHLVTLYPFVFRKTLLPPRNSILKHLNILCHLFSTTRTILSTIFCFFLWNNLLPSIFLLLLLKRLFWLTHLSLFLYLWTTIYLLFSLLHPQNNYLPSIFQCLLFSSLYFHIAISLLFPVSISRPINYLPPVCLFFQ